MAGTSLSTLGPFSTPPAEKPTPVGGRMGFFEDKFEETNEDPVNLSAHEIAKFPSVGSISFNSVVEKVQGGLADTASEALDLTKYILGVGETDIYIAQTGPVEPTKNLAQDVEGTTNLNALERARLIEYQLKRSLELDQSLSLEARKRVMNEALRITGRDVTKEEAMEKGHLDETAAATLADMARKDQEEAALLDKQEVNAQIPDPAKKSPSALETQFEGGSGKMGSGTASLSSASGAVG